MRFKEKRDRVVLLLPTKLPNRPLLWPAGRRQGMARWPEPRRLKCPRKPLFCKHFRGGARPSRHVNRLTPSIARENPANAAPMTIHIHHRANAWDAAAGHKPRGWRDLPPALDCLTTGARSPASQNRGATSPTLPGPNRASWDLIVSRLDPLSGSSAGYLEGHQLRGRRSNTFKQRHLIHRDHTGSDHG